MKKILINFVFLLCVLTSCHAQKSSDNVIKVYSNKNQDCILFDTALEKNKTIVCVKDTILFISEVSEDKKWVIINFSYWEKGMPRTEEVYKLFYIPSQKKVPNSLLDDYILGFEKINNNSFLVLGDEKKIKLTDLEDSMLNN